MCELIMNAWRESNQERNLTQKCCDVHHQSCGAGGVMEMAGGGGMQRLMP
jgi:hypothetical protein